MPFTLTGAQVRELRTQVGATQADLARALGYSKQAISYWECRGEHSIPRTQYQRVLDYLLTRRTSAETLRTRLNSFTVA